MASLEHTFDRPFIFLAPQEEQDKRLRNNKENAEAAVAAGYSHSLLNALQNWDDRSNLHWVGISYFKTQTSFGFEMDHLTVTVSNRDRRGGAGLLYKRKTGELRVSQGMRVHRGFHQPTAYITSMNVDELVIDDLPANAGCEPGYGGRQYNPSSYEEALVGKVDLGDKIYKVGMTKSGTVVAVLEPKQIKTS